MLHLRRKNVEKLQWLPMAHSPPAVCLLSTLSWPEPGHGQQACPRPAWYLSLSCGKVLPRWRCGALSIGASASGAHASDQTHPGPPSWLAAHTCAFHLPDNFWLPAHFQRSPATHIQIMHCTWIYQLGILSSPLSQQHRFMTTDPTHQGQPAQLLLAIPGCLCLASTWKIRPRAPEGWLYRKWNST